jgi:hypothetical protein
VERFSKVRIKNLTWDSESRRAPVVDPAKGFLGHRGDAGASKQAPPGPFSFRKRGQYPKLGRPEFFEGEMLNFSIRIIDHMEIAPFLGRFSCIFGEVFLIAQEGPKFN